MINFIFGAITMFLVLSIVAYLSFRKFEEEENDHTNGRK